MRYEEYEYLVGRSRRFYETALMLLDRGFYDLAAFNLEQYSLQLYLKAVLLMLGVDYPRSHSVRALLELVYKLTQSSNVGDILSRLSVEPSLLEDAYITARYVPKEFRREEVERLKRAVDEVLEVVGRVARGGG